MAVQLENDTILPRDALPRDNASTRVCVTGATGYLAGHVVQQLLEKGYTVHATCRNPHYEKSVAHLKALPQAGKLLRIFKADLCVPGSFDDAVAGCTYVLHTASPYAIKQPPKGKEEELMIRPAVEGTENVLNAVNKNPSVKRVIITASTASVFTDPHERGKGHVFTEADFNVSCTPTRFTYFYSKMRAEQRAYEMQEEAGGKWELCSICPGAIWGPPLGDRPDGESIKQIIDQMSGYQWPWAGKLGMGMVDVRDVARAHYLAMVTPQASGRYLINAKSCYLLVEACKVLRKAYPERWVPPDVAPPPATVLFGPICGLSSALAKAMGGKVPKIDASKAARDLGITQESYIEANQTILEMADGLIQKGLVPKFVMPAIPKFFVTVLFVMGVLAMLGVTISQLLL